jgi:hypothetical protein
VGVVGGAAMLHLHGAPAYGGDTVHVLNCGHLACGYRASSLLISRIFNAPVTFCGTFFGLHLQNVEKV